MEHAKRVAIVAVALCCAAAAPSSAQTAAERLNQLVEKWYDDNLRMNPIQATMNGVHDYDDQFPNFISPEYLAQSEAMEKRYLASIEAIDPSQLAGQDRLSWEVFRRDRQEALAQLQVPAHLMPVNQLFSVPVLFVQLGSPGGMTPFAEARDYEEFLGRVDGFADFMAQAIVNMREGVSRGIVLPKIIVEKTLPILASQIVEDPTQSSFYAAVQAFPESMSEADRTRLELAYRDAISTKIVPSYRAVHDYLRDEYMSHATDSIGISALPGGEEWYRLAIAQNTNSNLSAAEIHEMGKSEVRRIEAKIAELSKQVGFEGNVRELQAWLGEQKELDYNSEEDVLTRYRALRERVSPHIGKLFALQPKADFEIRSVEPYRQATTPGAHYMPPSPDGSRLGIFYVNTGNWDKRSHAGADALFLHEAVPGHHFQVALAQELEALPRFRRFGIYTAYVEGWGLYAESLGAELGLYQDPYQQLGQLGSELFRARRLVVDTGIHAMGWTRERALEVMPSPVEIDRYIVMPGQALAYKVGELKLQELRQRAQTKLGTKFDLREFHAQVLEDGALPLDVLEAKIDRWIESEAASR